MRLDKFLKVSRVIKRRTVANEACDNGRVSINGRPAKAGTQVKVGDQVTVEFAGGSTKFEILAVEENVKKANATEMYRIITSFVMALVITIGALTGFTGCSKKVPHEAGTSYVMSFDDTKVYDEQFSYLYAAEIKKADSDNEAFANAKKTAGEMIVLYNKGIEAGCNLTNEEIYNLKSDISFTLDYNLELNEDDNINTKDEICYYLTGMNVEEYVRFSVFKAVGEKYLSKVMEGFAPDESQQAEFYENNKDNLKACTVEMIYIKDKKTAKEAFDLLNKETYSFEVVAKGWSEDADVLDNGGVFTVTKDNDFLPEKVLEYIFSIENVPSKYEMIFVENIGYYIVSVKNVLDYESSEVKDYVLKTMILSEQSKRVEAITESCDVDFNYDKAGLVVDKFMEGRVK